MTANLMHGNDDAYDRTDPKSAHYPITVAERAAALQRIYENRGTDR